MNRLKGGPEIKMPKLRMPQFLVDLYHDLDERHLLPVVALLIIGIVAAPILLGNSSSSDEEVANAEEAAAATSAAATAKQSAFVVTKAAPGLGNYKKRLQRLQAKDPFTPHYVTEESDESEGSGSAAGGASVTTEESGSVTATGEESGGEPETTVTVPTEPKIVFFTFAIDIRVTPVSYGGGKPSGAKPYIRHDLAPLTMLPSRDTRALTYMGPSRDGRKALMVVSSDVTSLFGDSACIIGSETCQLLALEQGLPETVVFGPQERTYRFELLDINLVTSDHAVKQPLGKPKHGKPGGTPAG